MSDLKVKNVTIARSSPNIMARQLEILISEIVGRVVSVVECPGDPFGHGFLVVYEEESIPDQNSKAPTSD